MALDVGRGQEGHSSVGDFGKVWMLLEMVGFLDMDVQNAQFGYILDKSLNCQWSESFCNLQVKQDRY